MKRLLKNLYGFFCFIAGLWTFGAAGAMYSRGYIDEIVRGTPIQPFEFFSGIRSLLKQS